MGKSVVTIDGAGFTDLSGFFDQFQQRAQLGAASAHNLDAFNDVLRGGYGTPQGGFVLCWQHHALSRQRLGYAETARQLRRMLATCDPHNRASVRRDIAQALSHKGSTVYDWLLDIIHEHGPGGAEAEDAVELRLE
jgi:RNAse (barnase) inhibitor barstar